MRSKGKESLLEDDSWSYGPEKENKVLSFLLIYIMHVFNIVQFWGH